MPGTESVWSETAAWVEATGAIAAVIGAGSVAASESRATRRREERVEAAALRKEERAALATRTAALNLAIMWPPSDEETHLERDQVKQNHLIRHCERSFVTPLLAMTGSVPT
jgi:hypothetical protein